jgi:hypothetical protein
MRPSGDRRAIKGAGYLSRKKWILLLGNIAIRTIMVRNAHKCTDFDAFCVLFRIRQSGLKRVDLYKYFILCLLTWYTPLP